MLFERLNHAYFLLLRQNYYNCNFIDVFSYNLISASLPENITVSCSDFKQKKSQKAFARGS